MRSTRLKFVAAVLAAMVLAVTAGCSGPEKETGKTAPAAKGGASRAPAVPDALRKALVEAVALAPADSVAVGTFRSPRTLVDDLNEFAGPELSTVPGVFLSMLPAGAFDMDSPVAWVVTVEDGSGAGVFILRVKDPARLSGDAVEEGITRAAKAVSGLCFMRKGEWAVCGSEESVKAFKISGSRPRLVVDEATAGRIGDSLIWLRVNAKPLAALAKPELQEMKVQARANLPADRADTRVKAVEWLENLLGQLETLDVGVRMDSDRMLTQTCLTLSDGASLMAIAKALKPVEKFDGPLPETDRFCMAAWVSMDHGQAMAQVKAFLQPVVNLLLDETTRAAQAGPPAGQAPNPSDAARKAIEEQWKLLDEYGDVLGDRLALLAEIPVHGQGMYRMTEVFDLKDAAKYRLLQERSVAATKDLFGAITGVMPQTPDAPRFDMSVDYKAAAETIGGLPVDVMRFKVSVQPPEALQPGPQFSFKDVMDSIYGPEGLVMRMAVCENRAIAVVGGQELMDRAIRRQRGQEKDLAKQEAVAAALARVPDKASAVALISLPAYAASVDIVMDDVLLGTLPADRREAVADIPLPRIGLPALTPPTVLALRVDGRTIRLDVDMPQSEMGGSLPYVRHMYGRILFYVFQRFPPWARPEGMMMPPAADPGRAPMPPRQPARLGLDGAVRG